MPPFSLFMENVDEKEIFRQWVWVIQQHFSMVGWMSIFEFFEPMISQIPVVS